MGSLLNSEYTPACCPRIDGGRRQPQAAGQEPLIYKLFQNGGWTEMIRALGGR